MSVSKVVFLETTQRSGPWTEKDTSINRLNPKLRVQTHRIGLARIFVVTEVGPTWDSHLDPLGSPTSKQVNELK